MMRLAAWVLLALLVAPAPAWAGYTHYWTWKEAPTAAQLSAASADLERLLAAHPELVAVQPTARPDGGAGDGGTLPSVWVAFNGVGPAAHEDFVFPGNHGFNFCKTAQKPYDAVVTAALLVARDHFGPEVLAIESDGSFSAEWQPGAALYTAVFSRPARDPTTIHVEPAVQDPDQRGAATPRVRDPRWILVLAACLLGMLLLRRL